MYQGSSLEDKLNKCVADVDRKKRLPILQICPEMHADRRDKVSPSPNLHLDASNSIKHEDTWKLQ